jgi:microcin C transport system ATP-binding protein
MVEEGRTKDIFARPGQDYTRRLLAAEPKGTPDAAPAQAPEVMEARDLKVWFPIKKGIIRRVTGHVKAVDGVSLTVRRGHTFGVVGESGSGKSTLGRALLRLEKAREGAVIFEGREIQDMKAKVLKPLRREMQMVFQDPFGSLSPRLSIAQIVEEGLLVHGGGGNAGERRERIAQVLEEVGLEPAVMDRYPHEFSGGQRQRVSIARALVLKPKFMVLDEPTSALDMSIQAQIVELLRDLQNRYGLAYLFISHDLKVVRAMAHDVMVMRRGRVVEQGPADAVFANPQAPYTKALMAAAFEMKADDTGAVSR